MLLALWATAMAAGIALAVLCPPWLAAGGLAAAVVGGAWLWLRRGPALAIAALAFALGTAQGSRAIQRAGGAGRAGPPAGKNHIARVEATVIRGPEPADPAGQRYRYRLAVRAIEGRPAGGTLVLTAARAPPGAEAAPGDRVSFRAAPRAPDGLANPGAPDPRLLAAARGVDLVASLPRKGALRVDERGSALGPRRIAAALRRAMGAAIARELPPATAAFVRTVALGERTAVGERVEDGFRAAGATHALSVSGLHLAAVAALVFFLVRRLAAAVPGLPLRVRPDRVAAAVALPAVWMYTLLSGEAVATERSALMAGVALGGGLVGRPFSLPSAVAVAAVALLLRAPLVLLEISFQLSFASVIALALFAARLAPARRGGDSPGRVRRAVGWLGRFGAATVAAGLITAPLVAHHFGEITPAAPLGNLALVPLIELVVLPLSLGGALLALIHPLAGVVPLMAAGWGSQLALAIAEEFRRLAPVFLVRYPNLLETAALIGAAMALLAGCARVSGRRRSWLLAAGAATAVAAVSLGGRELARQSSTEVRVTFLDIGQGDAAVIEGPRGFVALIDGGGSYDEGFDPGARVIEPYLRRRGIARVDLVVLSHPHPDHLNGLFRVLSRFQVGAVWTSGDDGRNPRYRDFLALARARGAAAPVPAPWSSSGMTLVPIGPWLGDVIAAPPGLGVNDASLVVRLSYGGRSVLFAGDLEEDGEAELVARATSGLVALASDVLKVPHHGSRTSSSAELLDGVRPELAVASLGRDNRFRFPHAEVVARYVHRNVRVLRTDEVGAVTVTLSPERAIDTTCVRPCR